MSDKTADAAAPPPKSKKLLLIVAVVVLLLAMVGAGAYVYISKQRAALEGDEEPAVTKVEAKGPPVYLPLDNLVVNLGLDARRQFPSWSFQFCACWQPVSAWIRLSGGMLAERMQPR